MCKSTTLMLCSIPKAVLNKCISGQLEELTGVGKLVLYTYQLYIKVEGI